MGRDGLAVTPRDGALEVRGAQAHVDAYVRDLVAAGLALRSLTLEETPLETLFFMLTESSPDGVPAALGTAPGAASGARA